MAPGSPRVIPGTHCESSSWKWWPRTDRFAKRIRTAQLPEGRGSAQADPSQSNHRHADFQHNVEPGSARASRRLERDFRKADRTAPPDRAHTEPESRYWTEPRGKPKKRNGVGASRPNFFRTARRTGRRLQKLSDFTRCYNRQRMHWALGGNPLLPSAKAVANIHSVTSQSHRRRLYRLPSAD